MTKEPWTFRAADVVEEIYDKQEMSWEIKAFFTYSPLAKALKKALDSDLRDVLIDPPYDWVEDRKDLYIKSYRGSGAAISFKDASIYGPRGDSPHVEVKLEIEWESCYETFTRSYNIRIPVSLCREFSQEAFNAWVENCRQEKINKEAQADLKTLEELQTKYSVDLSDLIGKVKLKIGD